MLFTQRFCLTITFPYLLVNSKHKFHLSCLIVDSICEMFYLYSINGNIDIVECSLLFQ